MEWGGEKITKSFFEIGPVLKDMVNIVGKVAAEKQIRLEPPIDLNGMRIRADRLLLYQALTNLVTNAIKYSPPGTTVRIGVSNGGHATRFQGCGPGCGIPADRG